MSFIIVTITSLNTSTLALFSGNTYEQADYIIAAHKKIPGV
jgi:hypothetical protein